MTQEPTIESGLPSSTARTFAVNCFSIAALDLFLLIPPFYGQLLISNSILTLEKICSIIAFLQISIHFFRPNVEKTTTKTNVKKKVLILLLNLILLSTGVILYHIFAILYGAPFIEFAFETFHFALLMTILTILPLCLNLGTEIYIWYRIFLGSGRNSMLELYVHRSFIFTVIGSWIGAFAIPLDWDRPWQIWPIPCCIGALVANALCNSCMGIWLLYTEQSPKSKRRKKV